MTVWQVFTEHANKLVEVANLACTMSNNEDGVKMVRYGAAQIEQLCPQVINAACILAARPKSKVSTCYKHVGLLSFIFSVILRGWFVSVDILINCWFLS